MTCVAKRKRPYHVVHLKLKFSSIIILIFFLKCCPCCGITSHFKSNLTCYFFDIKRSSDMASILLIQKFCYQFSCIRVWNVYLWEWWRYAMRRIEKVLFIFTIMFMLPMQWFDHFCLIHFVDSSFHYDIDHIAWTVRKQNI